MASRSLFRLARPSRPPMHLYRIAFPYCPTQTFQRHNFSTTTSRPTPPAQNLDMNNPLYRDLIKSIKNPFVGDLIHKLVQGNASFTESLSQDLHGAGNSLYFRIPELPSKMKGHDQDPDGIPLPPNTFRVSSVEELRSILRQILAHRAGLERDEYTGRDNASVTAAAAVEESVRKEDTLSAEEAKSQPSSPKSDLPEFPVWNPSESFDAFKVRLDEYLKSGRRIVEARVQGSNLSSVLEPLERQVQQLRELLRNMDPVISGGYLEKRMKEKVRELGRRRRRQGREESIRGQFEKDTMERDTAQQREREKPVMNMESSISSEKTYDVPPSASGEPLEHEKGSLREEMPKTAQKNTDATSSQSQDPFSMIEKNARIISTVMQEFLSKRNPKDVTPGKTKTPTDTVEPATERITLMDILNGNTSSQPQKPEVNADKAPYDIPVNFAYSKAKPPGTLVDDPDSPPTAGISSTPHADLLIAKLSRELDEARKRVSELETPTTTTIVPDFQKFTDHMDEALATQYSDLRDYFEERVLSETRDVAARVGSLEKMMQKILDNQEAAAAAATATAQSKDGACIYSLKSSEPGEEPKVPVTVRLDEIDKAGIMEVVDSAVNIAVDKVLAGIDKKNEENNEDLVEAILEGLEDFKSYDVVENVVREVLNSEAMSKHLDSHIKVFVGQVLEELGKDQNGDLQRIVDAAVKAGMSDVEETVRSKLGDIQFKLFGMERIIRGM